MHSALYTGSLRHRRFAPREHQFSCRLFMVYVDLAELSEVFRGRWLWSTARPAVAWLRRGDFLGDSSMSIDTAVRERIAVQSGTRPAGPIRMLTHLRYFGVSFNPVTFYYCYDAAGVNVEYIVAEITNTPWRERHAYVLSDTLREPHARFLQYRFGKRFHVSPFMPMDLSYDWRFSPPGKRLTVHMQNFDGGGKLFDATLDLARREITAPALAAALLRFPCMSAGVVGAIYWQALRLWRKRIPFHPHPARNLDHAGHIGRHS